MSVILLLDGRRRVNLTKFLPNLHVRSVRVSMDGDKIVLEPIQIPARELWLYENNEAVDAVKTGLKQSKKGKLIKRAPCS